MRPDSRVGALVAACGLIAALASADTMFVSSFSTGEIYRYDLPSSTATTVVTGLTNPEDGACSPTGRLYFVESLSDRLGIWLQDGTFVSNVVPTVQAVAGPEGPTFHPLTGYMYFNTRERGGIADGAWVIPTGNPANGVLRSVASFTGFGEGAELIVAGPHQGGLLLVDRAASQVWISEPPGTPPTVIIDSTPFPVGSELFGVLTNGCGEIFVSYAFSAGSSPSDVMHFDPDGRFLEVYVAGLNSARHMEFDSDGNLYVADEGANLVYRVAPDRTLRPFASVAQAVGIAICRDRPIPDCPSLAVEFDRVEAACTAEGVAVRWSTLSEEDTNFFTVWRAADARGERGREPAGLAGATGAGTCYQVLDGAARCTPGRPLYYFVEEMTSAGPGDRSPVVVALPPDSAVATGRRARRR